MTRPSVLVFDLDGTLVNSMDYYADIFCDMLAQRGVPVTVSRPIFFELAGRGPLAQFQQVRDREAGQQLEANALTAEFWQLAEHDIPPLFPEVPAVLESLSKAGFAMYISTGSKPDLARRIVDQNRIGHHFGLVLGAGGFSKGEAHFELIRADLGLGPAAFAAATWAIGDSQFDMQVARSAGLTTVGRLTGANGDLLRAAGAQHLISDLGQLQTLIDEEQIA